MRRFKNVSEIVAWRMCLGCGACAVVCPTRRIGLTDYAEEGIRPVVEAGDCGRCANCLEVCPGFETRYPEHPSATPTDSALAQPELRARWGQVLEVWEGHATDAEIRFKGSSGGVLTALAAYCIEQGGMHGVLHTGPEPERPLSNRTRMSRSRAELLSATGSRYSPASVCDGANLVECAPGPCVVIGQPSEIAAFSNLRRMRPTIGARIGLTLSFFCAGSPPTQATVNLLHSHAIDASTVTNLRYRGCGWPGNFVAQLSKNPETSLRLTYQESWGTLQAARPWSVQLWPDGSGELADVTCGDPWHHVPDGTNPGLSLVLVRTETGRGIVHDAMAAGYLRLTRAEARVIEQAQHGLGRKKSSIAGRQLALRLLRIPTTTYVNASLWATWRSLPTREQWHTILGTVKRVFQRRLYRPLFLGRTAGRPVKPAALAASLRQTVTRMASATF